MQKILNEFNVGHCGIKVKVTVALAKFIHLIFQITSRWIFNTVTGKRFSKRYKFYISYSQVYCGRQSSICKEFALLANYCGLCLGLYVTMYVTTREAISITGVAAKKAGLKCGPKCHVGNLYYENKL